MDVLTLQTFYVIVLNPLFPNLQNFCRYLIQISKVERVQFINA